MNLSSGDPQPIFSNVALRSLENWKILALAHHLIKPHCNGFSNDDNHNGDDRNADVDNCDDNDR